MRFICLADLAKNCYAHESKITAKLGKRRELAHSRKTPDGFLPSRIMEHSLINRNYMHLLLSRKLLWLLWRNKAFVFALEYALEHPKRRPANITQQAENNVTPNSGCTTPGHAITLECGTFMNLACTSATFLYPYQACT